MKIVQAMVAKGFGGAERYFVDLSNHLAESGHDVMAIVHKEFRGRDQFIKCEQLFVESFSVLGWWDVRSRLAMQKKIQAFQPDVIHTHLARATYLCGYARKNLKIPLVVKTHNYVDLKYYKNVDVFIPTTEDQKSYLMKKGISSDRIRPVPNFSSLRPIEETEIRDHNEEVHFYAIGRMVKKKGFDILLRAFASLLRAGYKATLEIAGDGPEFKNLESLVTSLGLEKQVSFPGWVENIQHYAKDKDVFILPSLDEPFGIVLLEAMALGKPIISTRAKGPAEILNEETALLVDIGNASQLTEAMIRIIKETALARSLAQNGLLRFKKDYTRDAVTPRILDIYKSFSA